MPICKAMTTKRSPEPAWLSVTAAAEAIGMSRKFIVREIERRALEVHRFGRIHRIRREALAAYVAAHRIDAEAS